MYEHIKGSSKDRRASKDRAEAITARTVNKHRREEGRTPNKSSKGAGNPNRSLEDRSKQELYDRAKSLHIAGRSTMRKSELAEAIRSRS